MINEKEFAASGARSFFHMETLPYLNPVHDPCTLLIIILAQPSGVQRQIMLLIELFTYVP